MGAKFRIGYGFSLGYFTPYTIRSRGTRSTRGYGSLGGETFHRDPPVYAWCNHHLLQRCNLPITYGPPLDEHIDFNEYHVYNFNGSLVDDLEMAVNKGKDISTNPIIKFINNLVSKNYGGWVILSLDDEKIEVIKNISFQYSFLSLLVDGLKMGKIAWGGNII